MKMLILAVENDDSQFRKPYMLTFKRKKSLHKRNYFKNSPNKTLLHIFEAHY